MTDRKSEIDVDEECLRCHKKYGDHVSGLCFGNDMCPGTERFVSKPDSRGEQTAEERVQAVYPEAFESPLQGILSREAWAGDNYVWLGDDWDDAAAILDAASKLPVEPQPEPLKDAFGRVCGKCERSDRSKHEFFGNEGHESHHPRRVDCINWVASQPEPSVDASPEPKQGSCAWIGCGRDAEWYAFDGPRPDDFVLACTEHVGALLSDKPVHQVYPFENTRAKYASPVAVEGPDKRWTSFDAWHDFHYPRPTAAPMFGHETMADLMEQWRDCRGKRFQGWNAANSGEVFCGKCGDHYENTTRTKSAPSVAEDGLPALDVTEEDQDEARMAMLGIPYERTREALFATLCSLESMKRNRDAALRKQPPVKDGEQTTEPTSLFEGRPGGER